MADITPDARKILEAMAEKEGLTVEELLRAMLGDDNADLSKVNIDVTHLNVKKFSGDEAFDPNAQPVEEIDIDYTKEGLTTHGPY